MSKVARDRGARNRIREYLAAHGPIEDPTGLATAVLKDAVDYEGSPVAFIQLIAAMDRDGEITRDIRGKRTYQISSAVARASSGSVGAALPRTGAPLGVPADLDYDKLARALLREVARTMNTKAAVEADPGLAELVEERDRLQAERDAYADRLEAARRELSTMLGEFAAGISSAEQAS